MRTPVAVPLVRAPRKRGNRDKADPCTMVIFGGAGDLTKRKLMPGLYNLAVSRALPGGFAVVGVARREKSTLASTQILPPMTAMSPKR